MMMMMYSSTQFCESTGKITFKEIFNQLRQLVKANNRGSQGSGLSEGGFYTMFTH